MKIAKISATDFSEERKAVFLSRVDRRGPDECWPWMAGRHKNGYGYFRRGEQFMYKAHRVAYAIEHGVAPKDLLVLHKCDNPPCCNPAHLSIGTNSDNIADRDKKGRQAKGDRHFSRTHPERLARGERNGSRTHPEKRLRGEKNHFAVLSDEDILEIRRLYPQRLAGGIKLAVRFGISDGQLRRIVTGKSWTHLPLTP